MFRTVLLAAAFLTGCAVAPSNVVVETTFHKNGNGWLLGDFTIANKGSVGVKDVELWCTYVAPSGTALDSVHLTVFRSVPPHQQISVTDFGVGYPPPQAHNLVCNLEHLEKS